MDGATIAPVRAISGASAWVILLIPTYLRELQKRRSSVSCISMRNNTAACTDHFWEIPRSLNVVPIFRFSSRPLNVRRDRSRARARAHLDRSRDRGLEVFSLASNAQLDSFFFFNRGVRYPGQRSLGTVPSTFLNILKSAEAARQREISLHFDIVTHSVTR